MPTIEHTIEVFAVINLTIIGLSHMLAPGAWLEFFIGLRERGHAGALAIGMLSLAFGSVIVAGHNTWSACATLLTVIGWGHLIKATLYLSFPSMALRGLQRLRDHSGRGFLFAGAALIACSATIAIGWL